MGCAGNVGCVLVEGKYVLGFGKKTIWNETTWKTVVVGMIVLKYFKIWDWRWWSGLMWLWIGDG